MPDVTQQQAFIQTQILRCGAQAEYHDRIGEPEKAETYRALRETWIAQAQDVASPENPITN